MNPLMKRIKMSRWFVSFMGSHLSTEDEAARAWGNLLIDSKYADVSGKYFDGFKEIPSSWNHEMKGRRERCGSKAPNS